MYQQRRLMLCWKHGIHYGTEPHESGIAVTRSWIQQFTQICEKDDTLIERIIAEEENFKLIWTSTFQVRYWHIIPCGTVMTWKVHIDAQHIIDIRNLTSFIVTY
jgi:hypothetical protein